MLLEVGHSSADAVSIKLAIRRWNIFIFVIDGKRWEEGEREVYKEEHVSDEGAPFNVSM